jgi:hypothetical protein
VAGPQFTCFGSTKVQILTQHPLSTTASYRTRVRLLKCNLVLKYLTLTRGTKLSYRTRTLATRDGRPPARELCGGSLVCKSHGHFPFLRPGTTYVSERGGWQGYGGGCWSGRGAADGGLSVPVQGHVVK